MIEKDDYSDKKITKNHDSDQITTSVKIDKPDFKFIKERGYKATNLLRSKIQELKSIEFGEVAELKERIKRYKKQQQNFVAFIREKKLVDKFIEKYENEHIGQI